MTDRADFELLRAWRAGDRFAGRRLLLRHTPRLYRFFRNKTESRLIDLAHATLIACVDAKRPPPDGISFSAWLLALARAELLERGEPILGPSASLVEDHETSENPTVPDAASDDALHRALQRTLDDLPLDVRIAIELRYWEGMEIHEVAYVLGAPEHVVVSRLGYGRRVLEERLLKQGDQGIDPPTSAVPDNG